MSAGIFELVIGDKAWSTWSFRPWIAMRVAGIPFDEVHVRLRQDDTKEQILVHSPSGQVPALKWRGQVISDSLAICETLADLYPEKSLWPADPMARAFARSAAAEMHSGFTGLRRDMPMDMLNKFPGGGHTDEALTAAARIIDIWQAARQTFGQKATKDQGFLFGGFSIADAMFAPVVSRFDTYEVDLNKFGDSGGIAQSYMDLMLTLPAFVEWREGAKAEVASRS